MPRSGTSFPERGKQIFNDISVAPHLSTVWGLTKVTVPGNVEVINFIIVDD